MESVIWSIIDWAKEYSYFGVIVALAIEIVPGELVLPIAGYWVYQGDMTLVWTIVAGVIGGVLGPLMVYSIARFGGRPVIERYGKFIFIKPAHLDASDRFFAKYGNAVAFFGRFVPVVRTAISVPCGVAKMNPWAFCFYTGLGVLPVTAAYVYVGMKLGPHWQTASSVIAPYVKWLLIPIGLIAILYVVRARKKKGHSLSVHN